MKNKLLVALAIIAVLVCFSAVLSLAESSREGVAETPNSGNLMIEKDLGYFANYKGSITGGYSNEAVPDLKGKYDHSTY